MDPYSHTPGHAGARQPGLTGQVKEDILCRWGELGVQVELGQIRFHPQLLRRTEYLTEPADFVYFDVSGRQRRLRLGARSLAFTYCQVPVVYQLGLRSSLRISFADGTKRDSASLYLDAAVSRSVFERSGNVTRITVVHAPMSQGLAHKTGMAREGFWPADLEA